MIVTEAMFQKVKAQREARLQHTATHHPLSPPTPATPPIETSNVEDMAITKISILIEGRSGHRTLFKISPQDPTVNIEIVELQRKTGCLDKTASGLSGSGQVP